jgi:prepilin-type N-terminal cleavage/methylation domain-containing protein
MKQKGFTVIELLVAVVVLALAGTVFLIQKNDLKTSARDNDRKVAINAIHYSLEKVYFPANKSYPRVINDKTVSSIDPSLLKDPHGQAIGENGSDYRYEPSGCDGDACKGYSLRANLEREDDFVKTSQN